MWKSTSVFCLVTLLFASNIFGQNYLIWYDYPVDINAPGSNRGRGITTFSNGHSLQIMEVQGDYIVGGKDTLVNRPYRFHYDSDFNVLDIKPINYTNAPFGGYVFGHGNRKDHLYLYLSLLNGTYSFDSINFYNYSGAVNSNVLIAYDQLGNFVNFHSFDSTSLTQYIGVDHNGGPIFFEKSHFGPLHTYRYNNLKKDLSGLKSVSPWFTITNPLTNSIYPRIILPIENNQYLCAGIYSGNPDFDPTSAVFQFGNSAPEFYTFFAFMDSNFHVLSAKRFEFIGDVLDIQYSNGKILCLGRYYESTIINTISGALTLPIIPTWNQTPYYNQFILRMDTNLVADWVYYFADTANSLTYPMNDFNCSLNDPGGIFFNYDIGTSANLTNSGINLNPADQIIMMRCDTNGNFNLYGHMQHPLNQNNYYPFPQVILNDSTAFFYNQMYLPINLSMNPVPLYINQGQLCGSVYAAYRLKPEKKYTATGSLFVDLNADFIVDSTDIPVSSHAILSSPSSNTTFSLQDGSYSFLLDPGNNVIKGANLMHYNSCQPPFYTVTLSDSFPIDTGNVFYYSPETFICDFSVNLNGLGIIRTGQPYTLWVNGSNRGTLESTGKISIKYDGINLQFDSASITPLNIYQDSIVFATMNFKPLESKQFKMYFSIPQILPFGTIIPFSASIQPDSTCDYYVLNNDDSLSSTYLNSFDPNYKEAKGISAVNYNLVDSTFVIPYTIHFQNTGNDTAFNLVLVDTLSHSLDLSSIYDFQASHSYKISVEQGNILIVRFLSILLPDSGTNYAQSQGSCLYLMEISLQIAPLFILTSTRRL
jgi:uncharacterized repeat protein (TIGR01451 family)